MEYVYIGDSNKIEKDFFNNLLKETDNLPFMEYSIKGKNLLIDKILHTHSKNDKILRKCKNCSQFHPINNFSFKDSPRGLIPNNSCDKSIKIKKDYLRNNNIEKILRFIMNGDTDKCLSFNGINLEKICSYNNKPENVLGNFDGKDSFKLHHICFNEKGSKGKTIKNSDPINPSYWINNVSLFENLTVSAYEGIEQFLLCCVLSSDAHDELHHNYISHNIKEYLLYPDFFNLPYFLRSKDNYENVMNHLRKYGYDTNKFRSYEAQVKFLSDYKILSK